jgi:hypothetical protein
MDTNAGLRARAVAIASERLRSARPGAHFIDQPAGYVVDWADNLVADVTPADFESDLRRGSGSELDGQPDAPAKFCAAYSSCALTVNTFGPFRHAASRLTLAGISEFSDVEFEFPCDNGLQGTNPNFDLFARTRYSVVAVESKFLEPLSCKPADFSPQYARAFIGADQRPNAEEPWVKMYRRLCSDPLTYRYLDAAQLVKHYLGLWHSFPELNRTLFYLYWEPANAAELAAYRDFRREITDFALAVAGCDTRFVAKSYRAQLQEWQHNRAHLDLTSHLERLHQRYDFAV